MVAKLSRRDFLKAAGLAAALAGLAACTPAAPTAAPTTAAKQAEPTKAAAATAVPAPAKKVKIVVHDLVDEKATGPLTFPREQQKEFAATFPNIEVEHLPFPSVTVEKRKEYWITALSATSGGPSAIRFDAVDFTIQMARIGLAAPLDDYLPVYFKDWNDVTPIVKKISSYDGKVYSIPSMVEGVGYVVRRDYLEAAGYSKDYKPADYAEMATMIQKLTTPEHVGFMHSWFEGHLRNLNGGALATESADKNITLTYRHKSNTEVIAFLHGLMYPNNYTTSDRFADFATQLNDFQQGKMATFPFYPSWLNWLFGTAKFQPEELNFWRFPMGPSGLTKTGVRSPWAWISCWSWMINPNQPAAEKDAAAQYICWMNSLDQMKKEAKWWKDNELVGVFPSPFMSVPWTDLSTGVPAAWAKTLGDILELGGVTECPDFAGGTYYTKATEVIYRDPNGLATMDATLGQAEETTKQQWLDEYTKSLQK